MSKITVGQATTGRESVFFHGFTLEHLLRLIVAAIAVGLLVRVAQFVCMKVGTPLTKNQSMFLCLGVILFLLLCKIGDDTITAITYAAILVGAFTVSRIASSLIK